MYRGPLSVSLSVSQSPGPAVPVSPSDYFYVDIARPKSDGRLLLQLGDHLRRGNRTARLIFRSIDAKKDSFRIYLASPYFVPFDVTG